MKRIAFPMILAVAAIFSTVSCNKNEIVAPNDGQHKVNFTISGRIDPSLTRTYIEESGDTYLAHWSSESSEHIGIIFDDVVKDLESITFDALDITDDIATFYGSADVTVATHTIHPFYPASSFNKTYDSGKIGLTLNRIQYPVLGSFDPAADIMIGNDQVIDVDDADEVLVENIVFTRPMAVLRLHLAAKNDQAKAYGENVKSVEMEVLGQASTFALTGNLSYTPNDEAYSWNTYNASVKAVFDSEHGNSGDILIDTDADNNSVYLVVDPATIPSGTIKFTIETDNYSGLNSITRTVTVPEGGMEFLAGKVNEINLTIRDKDVPEVVSDSRILVEGFDNVTTNKSKPGPSVTGAFGTGVTSSLEYSYLGKNTNIRFNGDGQSSDNPFLYLCDENEIFTMSNIAISNQTWLDFSAKVKDEATLTIQYKESASETWTEAGTISGNGSWSDPVTVPFCVASTVQSLDIQLISSAVLRVDDIVLSPGTAPAHNLAVDATTKTLGGNQGATVSIAVTSNFAWTASISAGSHGFTISPSSGSSNGTITVTAANDGTNTEVELGKVLISDGEDNVEVTIRQEEYTAPSDKYVKVTSLSDVTAGTYVIVNDGYYLPNSSSNNSPVKNDNTKVTVSDNAIVNVTEAMTWVFSGSSSAMTIKSTAGNYYLVIDGDGSTSIRVKYLTGKTWTISQYPGTTGAFTLKDNTTNRYCATYSSGSDWRSYTSYAYANYGDGGKVYLYKKTTSGGDTPINSIVIDKDTENFPTSYGKENTFTEYTLDGLKYKIQQVYLNGSKLQWRAANNSNGTGTMYNADPMPKGIASIVIVYNSSDNNKNHTVQIGSSANPASATTITPTISGSKYTFTCDGTSKYFVITNGAGAGYIDSITINF